MQLDLSRQLKSLDEEKLENIEIYEKMKGTPVKFGDKILLLHYFSNKYLLFDKNNVSDFENENLR